MEYIFHLPTLTEGDEEGAVVTWFKAEGEPVAEGELLLEVQFAKVATEITSPVSGVLAEILVGQGRPVKVGQALCRIMTEDGAGASADKPAAAEATAAPAEKQAAAQPAAVAPAERPRSTPAARRLARELGIDLAQVKGTGPGGRITEDDVRRAAEGEAPAAEKREAVTDLPGAWQPMSTVQKIVASRMLTSLQESAQFTLSREVDVTALVELRERWRGSEAGVTLTDLIHRAVIVAIESHPRIQAILSGDNVFVPDGVHLGMAVPRDDDLYVAVIRSAHALDLPGLAAERRRLNQRIQEGRATADEMQGATFTVTNLGAQGIDVFTPILNPPNPATLGVGRVRPVAAVVDGHVQVRHAVWLSLTVDHRVINGAPGAEFLQTLAEIFAAPEERLGR